MSYYVNESYMVTGIIHEKNNEKALEYTVYNCYHKSKKYKGYVKNEKK